METLEIVRIFEQKKFNRDDAIKIAEAINGKSGLARKEDIAKLEAGLKEDIVRLEAELKEDIAKLEAELKEDIARLEAELNTKSTKEDIARLKAELKEDIVRLEVELNTKSTKEDIARLDTSMKWIMGILIGGIVALFGAIIASNGMLAKILI